MPPISKLLYIVFILVLFSTTGKVIAQPSEKALILIKQSNQNNEKKIEPHSQFRIKTVEGEKIKGKYAFIGDNFFVSEANDTIFLKEIIWIKSKTKLTRLGTAVAATLTFGGIYFSIGTVPAAFIIWAMEGSTLIFLAPVATISASVIGFRMLKGRKYKLNRWTLESRQIIN